MTVRKPPPIPTPQAPIVESDGRPTKEFFTFLAALLAWAKEADAELG